MGRRPPKFDPPHLKAARARAQAEADRRYDQTTRRHDAGLAHAKRLRSTVAWQRVRAAQLARHPLCADPLGQHTGVWTPAMQVHHIHGLALAPERWNDAENLASLCVACHAAIEAEERAGRPTAHLFAPKA